MNIFSGTDIKIKKIDFIIVFFIMYIQYSLWFLEYNGSLRMVLTLGLIGILLIFYKFKLHFNVYSLIVFCVSILCIVTSCLVNGINIQLDIWTITIWFCALLITSIIDSFSFYKAYTKTVAILAFFGTLIFCLSLIMPSIFISLPILDKQSWTGDTIIHNAFLGTVSLYSNFKRNFSIFYEPGLFAFHLNFAIYLELFVLKKPNIRYLAICLVALLTTFSTNGFITIAIFLMAFFLNKHKGWLKSYAKRIRKISIAIVLVTFVILLTNKSIWVFLTSKLFEANLNTAAGSGVERSRAFVYAINAFLENPIFGLGGNNWGAFFNGNIATFTLMNWFAIYGVVYGLLCFVLYTRMAWICKNSLISLVLQFIGLLTLIASQNVSNYLIIIIFMLYNANTFHTKVLK